MDLLVATMNGNVYCFQTEVLYHPLKVGSLHPFCFPSSFQAVTIHFDFSEQNVLGGPEMDFAGCDVERECLGD